MKWKNKTKELDIAARNLLRDEEKFKHIYIFGSGIVGNRLMKTFQKYGILEGFIDNDINKQKKGHKGYKVYSPEEYLKVKNGVIVIAIGSEEARSDIVQQMATAQLVEGDDFFSYIEFNNTIFPIVSVYLYNKAYVSLAQISLTERCSLKCKKCAHGCFAVDNKTAEDLTIEQVYKSADSFFDKVDFVQEFDLIGGEPLLYRQLADVIQYIGQRYGEKIGVFSITTNGTILPDEKTLSACKENDILFRISNYRMTIPSLEPKYKNLIGTLYDYGIQYSFGNDEIEWKDYGFDYVDRNASEEELIQVFDNCKTSCREVRENKFYFCVMARSVSENMGFHVGDNDYLDLDALRGENYKKELLEFNLGYSEKGYLDMCNHCHGADSVKYPIPVAEQADR